jgi:hypothetical protein
VTDARPPGLEFIHNTDLNPGDDYLASVPRLDRVLRHPALLDFFQRYDPTANTMQKTLRFTGTVSLWLGGLALAGSTAKLLIAALEMELPQVLIVVFEVAALVSVALALGPWFARTRRRWLTARFVSERIRQWHFQMLLDGRTVSLAHTAPEEFERIRAKRWSQFTTRLASAQGAMVSFIDGEMSETYHPVESYRDPETGQEVFRAYMDLRFQNQLAYFKFSRDKSEIRDEWSESIARWTLFSAVLLAAGQIAFVLFPTGSLERQHTVTIWIAGASIWLVTLSTAIRVYRNATAVSQQRERYEMLWVRLVALKKTFDSATRADAKLRVMHEVELLEIEECREFLRQMSKASYLL